MLIDIECKSDILPFQAILGLTLTKVLSAEIRYSSLSSSFINVAFFKTFQ